jgi:protein-S-isoprenylcysteine O-methyltransferase Ste14
MNSSTHELPARPRPDRVARPVNRRRDSAGVIPPPVLYGAALIAALLVHALYPIRMAASSSGRLQIVGAVLIVIGLMLSIAVMRAFAVAGTPVTPWRPTTRLVSTGPYRYTRNPDYIGQALMYAGIAVVVNSWWPIFFLPLVLVIVQHGVIRREERYLEGKFGEKYRDYTARVRPWL